MAKDEYEQRQFWGEFKDINLNASPSEFISTLVLSEKMYDMGVKYFGENCGYDKRIKVIRGYPKFEDNNK